MSLYAEAERVCSALKHVDPSEWPDQAGEAMADARAVIRRMQHRFAQLEDLLERATVTVSGDAITVLLDATEDQ